MIYYPIDGPKLPITTETWIRTRDPFRVMGGIPHAEIAHEGVLYRNDERGRVWKLIEPAGEQIVMEI